MQERGVSVPEGYGTFAKKVFERMARGPAGPHTESQDVAEEAHCLCHRTVVRDSSAGYGQPMRITALWGPIVALAHADQQRAFTRSMATMDSMPNQVI